MTQDHTTGLSPQAEGAAWSIMPRRALLAAAARGYLRRWSDCSQRRTPRQYGGDITCRQTGCFAIVGDLQQRSWIEFWRESNRAGRAHIIRQIAQETPDFLAVVGDLVFCGASRTHWAEFDDLFTPLYDTAVPVLPTLGNHDYWLSRQLALRHFFSRFPHLVGRHWYTMTYGQLGLVFLDSNVRWLPARRWREQLDWYCQELERFEQDPEIAGVLVLLHHPPYTNSLVTPDERHVQRAFVPAFMRARKTLAMISGHVHSYERFERAGKTFLVTGGCGPRIKLATGTRRRHYDDLFTGPARREFHFLRFTLSSTGLTIEMRGLRESDSACKTLDHFASPWVPAAQVVGAWPT